MLNKQVEKYLSTARGLPFFYCVSEKDYPAVFSELKQSGLEIINVCDFCKNDDKNPSIDDIIDFFRTADVDYKTNKYVLVGLGEYLALHGNAEALSLLRELKSKTLGNARVVILLKFVNPLLKELLNEDIRFKDRVITSTTEDTLTSIVVVPFNLNVGRIQILNGVKHLIKAMSEGQTGLLYVKTEMRWEKSLIPVDVITDAYSLIKRFVNPFGLSNQIGNSEQWSHLLNDLVKHDFSIDKVFSSYHFSVNKVIGDIENAFGLEYRNWLYFVFLKLNVCSINNQYLRFVIESTERSENFKIALLNSIIHVEKESHFFSVYYEDRKTLVKNFDEADIAIFVNENAINSSNGICRLTDNTLIEKQAIIKWVANNGIIPELEYIYPALFYYLKDYTFDCGKLSQLLTKYFVDYKKQKVLNTLFDGFEQTAHDNSMQYAHLDTRENVLSSIEDKESSLLVWVDALGVEYLSYIDWLIKDKGVSLKTHIVRADLPTITSVNKSFFDNWAVSEKIKVSELDEIKHKEKGGFDNEKCNYPIYLANELDVIQKVMKTSISKLISHNAKKVIIASDHGASRLAVLCHHDEKYYTDTKGEHSGRCCKYFDDYDVSNSVAENGYVILTDYGRFKGSRAANVEVHGGASLEETVIPLLELTLKSGTQIEIRLMNPDNIVVDRKKGVSIELYVSDVSRNKDIRIVINSKSYIPSKQTDEHHFVFELSDIKRSGNYIAEVFEAQDLIGEVKIRVKGAVGSSNTDFDDLF